MENIHKHPIYHRLMQAHSEIKLHLASCSKKACTTPISNLHFLLMEQGNRQEATLCFTPIDPRLHKIDDLDVIDHTEIGPDEDMNIALQLYEAKKWLERPTFLPLRD
ncbi:hypothetical protein [Neptuniibacter halophilus]|uniref:hypothetical protein n=1 Tax=Neptuniibacter halophilus TaxID=651666 RepID=UPI002572E693|nr:hypothetical protein [Neptuniibacter halophilus]